MFHAERLGLSHIVERLQAWHGRTGRPQFDPSLLLLSLAALGGSFATMPGSDGRATRAERRQLTGGRPLAGL